MIRSTHNYDGKMHRCLRVFFLFFVLFLLSDHFVSDMLLQQKVEWSEKGEMETENEKESEEKKTKTEMDEYLSYGLELSLIQQLSIPSHIHYLANWGDPNLDIVTPPPKSRS